MRAFVDTNVLMDFIFHRKEFADDAKAVFEAAFRGKIEAAISSLTVINTCYTARHYGYSGNDINGTLLKIMQYVKVLGMSHEVIKTALGSGWNDTEDAAQYYTALSFGADLIITRDSKGFSKAEIPVVTPKELLQILN